MLDVKLMNNQKKMLLQVLHGDGTGWLRTIIVNLALLCSTSAHAQLDLNLTAGGRTYPMSGIVESEIGYGHAFWGGSGGGGGGGGGESLSYGYIRPFAVFGTSGNYNAITTGAEFFPISFMGLRAGGEYSNNAVNYTAYPCEMYNCRGTFYRSFVEGRVAIGNKKVFGLVKVRREKWSQGHELEGDFIDPNSGLVAKANGDTETLWITNFGISVNDRWKVITGIRYAEMINVRGISQLVWLGGSYQLKPVDIGFGIGSYASALKDRGMTLFLSLSWEIYPSIGLH